MSLNVVSVLVGGAARWGGTPAFVGESALEASALGANTKVFTTDLALAPAGWWQRQKRVRAGELHPAVERADTTVFPARFPRRLAFSPAFKRGLVDVIPRCELVHIHNLWQYPQYAAYRLAVTRGVPYIASPHGGLDPYQRRHGRLRKRATWLLWQRQMLDQAALIHVTTEAEADLIADVAPHVPRRVVPCAVHSEEFTQLPPRAQFRQQHLAGYDGALILFLSRLTYKKGLDALVRAFAHARRQLEARLVIVGPDDEGLQRSLERLAGLLGVSEDVRFTGPLYGEDRLAALASADVWALSSYTENFGIAVVEALAAGCAVVVSPAVNIAADIAGAQAGLIADISPQRFASALLEVLTNTSRRAALQANARSFARRYDWRVVAPQLVEMYREAARAAE